jgi:MoaA/NifB/PqqE/SkfB family radical SAM enzyme
VYAGRLDFLWLELTNRCNLQCVHCYTESHPGSGDRDVLTTAQYESVMRQAYALGCRRLQFIGGEPQLHPDFLRLLGVAKETGFEFIEVFTNLTRLRDDTLRFAADAGIRFATSVYSDDPAVHNAITKVGSSHTRTIKNLERLIALGVGTRAAVIRIDQEPGAIERTRDFLRDLGVPHVRDGEVRGFGRGQGLLDRPAELDGLCGHCWAGKLCVAPDGEAYPCVMARQWAVGNVLEAPLAEIVHSAPLADMRRTIYQTVWCRRRRPGAVRVPTMDRGSRQSRVSSMTIRRSRRPARAAAARSARPGAARRAVCRTRSRRAVRRAASRSSRRASPTRPRSRRPRSWPISAAASAATSSIRRADRILRPAPRAASRPAAPRAASRQVARRAQPDRRAGPPAMTFARPQQRRSRRRWPWSSYPR